MVDEFPKSRVLVVNQNQYFTFPTGTTLLETAKSLYPETFYQIMSAQLEGQLVDLHTTIEKEECKVEFFFFEHPEGKRTYTRSLLFLLGWAIKEIFPGARLKVLHSIGDGLFCKIERESKTLTAQEMALIEQKMRQKISENRPFNKEIMSWEQAFRTYSTQKREDLTLLFKYWRIETVPTYRLDNYRDYYYGPLCPSTGYLQTFGFVLIPPGFIIQLPSPSNLNTLPPYLFRPKLFQIFQESAQWAEIVQIENVGELNQAIVQGKGKEIVSISEALHEKKIAQIADFITQRRGALKLVLIAGPSSSGKTTFARRLYTQLRVNGWNPITISLDDYFRSHHELKRRKLPDWERPEALDLKLFKNQIAALIEGQEVEIPRYNFITGTRERTGQKTRLGPEGIIVVEGLHALNPLLSQEIPEEQKFKIYISAITQINLDDHNRISTTDCRLVRRLVRDNQFRNSTAQEVFKMWPAVRRGEEEFIFPFQEDADLMFNSSLIYEMSVLRTFAERLLRGITPEEEEYIEAHRLYSFLNHFIPLSPSLVPSNSILREFIG